MIIKRLLQGLIKKLQELRYIIWPDGPGKQLEQLKAACPRLVINATPKMMASTAQIRLPVEADMRFPLDADNAAFVSQLPSNEIGKPFSKLQAKGRIYPQI